MPISEVNALIRTSRQSEASSEGGMVNALPGQHVTYLDATEHPGTVQEYKIMSTPESLSPVNWLILGASATVQPDWT